MKNIIPINVLSTFDGISCGQMALAKGDIDVDQYHSYEIDKFTIQNTMHNFPNTIQNGDILALEPYQSNTTFDLYFSGSPYQDLSKATTGVGLVGVKSSLFYEQVRILHELLHINPYMYYIIENVVPRKAAWLNEMNEAIGVEPVLINSDLFVQQNRPRLYWTNIPIPNLPTRPEWEGNFFLYRRTYYRQNKQGVCPCLTANMGTGGHNVPLYSRNLKDQIPIEDIKALQSIPEDYEFITSKSQTLKAIGNGWTVDVITHILGGIDW